MFSNRPRQARIAGLLATATAVAAGLVSAGPAQALTGPEATPGQLASVAKLNIGDEANSRACTAILIDASWLATAASCFAATPGQQVPAGKPALKATATLSNGQAVEITDLQPRTDRDLVLARLATPVSAIATVKAATTAPAAGADLTAAGFGRTKSEWVPDKLHTGVFTTGTADATTLTITGKGTDVLCKGDTGGPLLNAAGELVGINSRSWQGGCLGAPATETRTGAISARVDDLDEWVRSTVRMSAARDLNGDGRSDAAMVYHHSNGTIGFYSSFADTAGGFGEFTAGYTVPASGGWDRNSMKLISGDFNGDRRSDLGMMYRHTNGTITMHTGLADGAGRIQAFTQSYSVPANAGWDWNAIELHSGDLNGDGRSDAAMVYYHSNGTIGFYSSFADTAGGFGEFTAGYTVPASGGWDRNSMKLISGDFNGDRRSDLGMMYHHSNGTITMHTGLADNAGRIQAFTQSYSVPANAGWDWNAIELHSGDLNGDGRSDAAMVYYHSNGTIGFHSSFADTAGGFGEFTAGYTVPASGGWIRNSMKLISGDFNGDRRSDLGMMYRHTNGTVTMHTGLADDAGHIQAFTQSYSTPANAGWDWNAIELP
ncbi:S1 family peptidase [Streptomyces bambusae]|uniref:Trypsin-like serine protease n=1 Tax=Streptomyces bambusae TaxID=1550616 RepID=A0ABS6YZT7_9ACTN|nr:S1 family peptidase [Streptomyces bambusae]MBW5481000.1 trypsin-like serine protease [Streptomyces bambusae]